MKKFMKEVFVERWPLVILGVILGLGTALLW